jgi:hypothetical protein
VLVAFHIVSMRTMTKITLDFSNLPSDVALVLSRQQHTRDLVGDLSGAMSLGPDDRELLHQELVGSVAKVVDDYLAARPTLEA